MSAQLVHSLKYAGVMIVLAGLGVAVQQQTDILQAANVPLVWWPVIGAGLAALVRVAEGFRDASRAENGEVVPADVGYTALKAVALGPSALATPGVDDKVQVHTGLANDVIVAKEKEASPYSIYHQE